MLDVFGIRKTYFVSLVIARKTRSSTGTVGVKTVALFPLASATCFASPLRAGPTGLELSRPSPGSREMRVVFGVQLATPVHVSRIKTWRRPLFGPALVPAIRGIDGDSGAGVTATNATNLPLELSEGRMLSVPVSAPWLSVEINVVVALQVPAAARQVSRRKICLPAGEPATRFVDAELYAM